MLAGMISIHAQTTFNKDLKIMNFISRQGSILSFQDTIIGVSYGTDYNPFDKYVACIVKFDIFGNMLNRSIDSTGYYHYQETNDSYIVNNTLIVAGDAMIRDSVGAMTLNGGYIWVFDLTNGTILKKIKFSGPGTNIEPQIIGGLAQIDSTTYAVISGIDEKWSGLTDSQITLANIETDSIKYIQFGRKNVSDIPRCIAWTGKKLLVGSGFAYPDYDILNPYKKRYSHTLIYEIDTAGTVREAYVSDTMRTSAREIMVDDESNIIFLTSKVNHDYYEDKDEYHAHLHNCLTKLDDDFNVIWESPVGLPYDFQGINGGQAKIIPSLDGMGYITASYQSNYPWNITPEGKDSMRAEGEAPRIVGILHKFSEDGESIWMRSYSVVNDISIYHITHHIKDLTYGPDGGYIAFGEIDYDGKIGIDTVANYHAWLFKVDEYGCFVPGCQNQDTVGVENIPDDIDIKLYPNPTSDRLYIYQENPEMTKYTITTISGLKVNEWRGSLGQHTYILDINRYKPGIYVLVKENNDGIRTKKFIVE